MSKSVKRVEEAARAAGLDTEILRMPDTTRTATEAARAVGCEVAQIAKSMIFEGQQSGALVLVLVSGRHNLNLEAAPALFGEALTRADPARVRSETGFAIGGVAPIGHLCAITSWMDDTLMGFGEIWAAAGAPNAVFRTSPRALQQATGATLFTNS